MPFLGSYRSFRDQSRSSWDNRCNRSNAAKKLRPFQFCPHVDRQRGQFRFGSLCRNKHRSMTVEDFVNWRTGWNFVLGESAWVDAVRICLMLRASAGCIFFRSRRHVTRHINAAGDVGFFATIGGPVAHFRGPARCLNQPRIEETFGMPSGPEDYRGV